MKPDYRRSIRLNEMLVKTLRKNLTENQIFSMAKSYGVTDETARDYTSSIISKVKSMRTKKND